MNMKSPVNAVTISEEETQFFADHGFIKIKNLLTLDAVDELRNLTRNSNQMTIPPDVYSGELSKIGYDIDGSIVQNIYSSKIFKDILNKLTSQELTFMQGIGFEVEVAQSGFPWHHDIYSFCYTRPDDFGYTLWIPLIPIDTQKQHGGLAYVSRQVHSARYYFNLAYRLATSKNFPDSYQADSLQDVNFQYASKFENLVLEENKIEDDFALGDVLLLDKTIWHRSCPLNKGLFPSRMAYVIRFIGSNSRYSQKSVEGTYFLLNSTGNDVQSDLGGRLLKTLKDGEVIAHSLN
ncbi:MAG: hypothetical protein AAGD25_05845 [Cyanobacteria bacterium P01_F01_bin.150]